VACFVKLSYQIWYPPSFSRSMEKTNSDFPSFVVVSGVDQPHSRIEIGDLIRSIDKKPWGVEVKARVCILTLDCFEMQARDERTRTQFRESVTE